VPRVSEQYIERRRREILEAAWLCFARDGFHATTMDDVIEAAGVSPSVVYRWFRGKDELINATVAEVLQGLVDIMDELLQLDPLPSLAEALEQILTRTLARLSQGKTDFAALAVQAWSEALRNPEINSLVAGRYRQLRGGLAELIRRHQTAGALPPDFDPDAAAAPLFSMLPGFVLQRLLLGPEDAATYARAAGALLRA
jgi:AcrR family transcriptional regulator